MAEVGVNTDIYKPRPQENPFDQITKITGAISGLGDLAVGQSMQKALNPDGTVDVNMLSGLLKQSPAGALKAVPQLDAIQKLREAGYTADQAGLETFQKRMAITHHLFSGLASKEKPTYDDVLDIAAKAMDPSLEAKKYGITLPVIMNALKQFRGPDGKPLPPDKIREKALQIQTQAATTAEILEQHSPRVDMVDRGSSFEMVPRGTRGNPIVGGMVRKNLGPTQETMEEGGSKRPLGEQPATPGYIPPPQGQQPPVAAPPVEPKPTGPISDSGPGLKMRTAERERALSLGQDLYPLEEALSAAQRLGERAFGPGTDELNQFKTFAKNVGATWIPGLDFDKIEDYNTVKKYLTQAAQARAGAFGGHTDQQLATTLAANPNTTMSQLSIVKLTKAAIALRRMEVARTLEADKLGIKDKDYAAWATKWATQHDPRAFMIDKLEPDELEYMIKTMKPGQKEKFNKSYQTAIDIGILPDPRGAQK